MKRRPPFRDRYGIRRRVPTHGPKRHDVRAFFVTEMLASFRLQLRCPICDWNGERPSKRYYIVPSLYGFRMHLSRNHGVHRAGRAL